MSTIYLFHYTLSGRPGGYPDDDLIKFKKKTKNPAPTRNSKGDYTLITCCTKQSRNKIRYSTTVSSKHEPLDFHGYTILGYSNYCEFEL